GGEADVLRGLLGMGMGGWVGRRGGRRARNYRAQGLYGGSLLSTQQGLWAKDGKNFVYIERVKGDEELAGISIYAFNEQRGLQSVRYADSEKLDPKHEVWRVAQCEEEQLQEPEQKNRWQQGGGNAKK
ncbi:LptF/LptG family permease, partial [Salmonella enterica]|uniref:LptF/LptG family permease n=1 Tax=Salmonella enterica TaxID=28901 RepID=UPI00398C78EC